jgi:uncharacterized Zn finger protein (UPF0148 family)
MSGSEDTRTAEEIEADLARTREALGETVEQLAAKADVKARSKQWVHDTSERTSARARRTADEHGRELALGAAAVAGLVVVIAVWRVRRR